MTSRRPATHKSQNEMRSRERALCGMRYLPAGARPFKTRGPKLADGIYVAVLDITDDEANRMLIREGYLTKADLDADAAAKSHKRADAAIHKFLTLTFGNTLRATASAHGNVAGDQSNEPHNADACPKDGK